MALQPDLTLPIFYRFKFIDSAFNNQTFSGSDPPPFNLTFTPLLFRLWRQALKWSRCVNRVYWLFSFNKNILRPDNEINNYYYCRTYYYV
jgi:hypothetical protein